MKVARRILVVACAVALGGAVLAQEIEELVPSEPEVEEETPATATEEAPAKPAVELQEDESGAFVLELATWVAQPVGLQYHPVVRGTDNPFESRFGDVPHGTEGDLRARFGYSFPRDIGDVTLTWWSSASTAGVREFDPGNFVLAQTLTQPTFAGVFNDGRADGVAASLDTRTRDLRIDFSRNAFETKRVRARWSVGLRRVDHARKQFATYYSLAPNLPAIQEPLVPGTRPDLDPRADTARLESTYSGRGPGLGLDLQIPILRRLRIDAGFGAALLRGKVSGVSRSLTHVYGVVANDVLQRVLSPLGSAEHRCTFDNPYCEFEDPDPNMTGEMLITNIRQVGIPLGIESESTSVTSQVLEGYVGLRFDLWKTLQLTAGYRASRYDDIGLESTPVVSSLDLVGRDLTDLNGVEGPVVQGVRVEGLTQTPRSAGYEGFYFGLGYRY